MGLQNLARDNGTLGPEDGAMHERRSILCTVTGEPFQPARIYYSIPSKSFVTKILSRLECMEEDPEGGRWVWLYMAEAASLRFGRPRSELPAEVHPVVIGALRFPGQGEMTLEVRSLERAIAAARFFAPRLGPSVVARRARVVNRLFDPMDVVQGPSGLDAHLDRDVTVIDPRVTEERIKEYLAGARTPQEAQRALDRYHEDRRRERSDVPLVEDFPLAPEEETADFELLALTLRVRGVRAIERRTGNPNVTLEDILQRIVEESGSPEDRRARRAAPARGAARSSSRRRSGK